LAEDFNPIASQMEMPCQRIQGARVENHIKEPTTMHEESRKRFDSIHDDYSFFQKHSTEAESDIKAYLPYIRALSGEDRPVRMLDFGAGDGVVTEDLLSRTSVSPEQLHLSLVEPDAQYLKDAVKRLRRFTAHPIFAWAELPPDLNACFDVIISNNVLYYVPDLNKTLSALIRGLASPGVFISSVAGRDNTLVQYTTTLFDLIGKPYPFWLAEECEKALCELGEEFEIEGVHFELIFRDSEESRLSMARFLMGSEYPNIPRKALMEGFDNHRHDGNIVIKATNKHLIVRR
jgi:SAM-dependent methyltransferase